MFCQIIWNLESVSPPARMHKGLTVQTPAVHLVFASQVVLFKDDASAFCCRFVHIATFFRPCVVRVCLFSSTLQHLNSCLGLSDMIFEQLSKLTVQPFTSWLNADAPSEAAVSCKESSSWRLRVHFGQREMRGSTGADGESAAALVPRQIRSSALHLKRPITRCYRRHPLFVRLLHHKFASLCLDLKLPFCPFRHPGVALLDQAGGGGHRLHWRTGVHVRPVQGLHPPVAETQGLQPGHIRPEPAGHV